MEEEEKEASALVGIVGKLVGIADLPTRLPFFFLLQGGGNEKFSRRSEQGKAARHYHHSSFIIRHHHHVVGHTPFYRDGRDMDGNGKQKRMGAVNIGLCKQIGKNN